MVSDMTIPELVEAFDEGLITLEQIERGMTGEYIPIVKGQSLSAFEISLLHNEIKNRDGE